MSLSLIRASVIPCLVTKLVTSCIFSACKVLQFPVQAHADTRIQFGQKRENLQQTDTLFLFQTQLFDFGFTACWDFSSRYSRLKEREGDQPVIEEGIFFFFWGGNIRSVHKEG